MESLRPLIPPSSSASSSIYDKPLSKSRGDVSLSAFAFLFSELVQYTQNRIESVADLEKKLEENGYGIGIRMVELAGYRDRLTRRETRVVNVLQYISNILWKYLFNKAADNLERSTENEDEYMIHESSPITNTFVSVPSDMGQLNCAAFLAGIIAGALDSTRFNARVTAHLVQGTGAGGGGAAADGGGGTTERTVFLIKFSSEVMARERKMGPI